jgi:exopolysaccharide biosynthesis polyprenyl glycosylphosphotransferase
MAELVKSLPSTLAPRLAFSERRLLLRIGDLLLISGSILLSLWVWGLLGGQGLQWQVVQAQLPWAALLFFGWPIWLFFNDLYNLRWATRVGRTVRRILVGTVLLFVVYLFFFFVTARTPALSLLSDLSVASETLRLAPALALAISTASLLCWRVLYALILGGSHARRRLIILGAGSSGRTLLQAIHQLHQSQYHIIGFVDSTVSLPATEDDLPPLLGTPDRLLAFSTLHAVDEIVVAIPTELKGALFQTIMDCHERGVAITPMPLLYERLTGRVPVEHVGDQWYVALPLQQRATSTLYRFAKRLMDLIGGLLFGLLLLLVFPLVALAIKLDGPGPIFYGQERMGQHGRRFTVRKFRSMVQDAERNGQAQWAVKNDNRITRVGYFLRKTRLDELPQVLNVLTGEMSMVGPRPERPQFIDQLQHQIPFYRTRLAAKPGLTGWAQVNYGYGSTVEDALIKLQYDLFYIKNQSPWFDLTIMLRTIGVVLRMKGQ